MTDILITPITGTVDFTNNSGEVLRMSGSGDPQATLELSAPSGTIASFKDSFEDAYFSINDQSELAVFEVLSDNRVKFFGPLIGKTYDNWDPRGDHVTTTEQFLPWTYFLEDTSPGTPGFVKIAPVDGKFIKAFVNTENAAGNTTLKLYIDQSASEDFTSATVNIGGTNTSEEFDLGDTPFIQGDRLYITAQSAVGPGEIRIVVIVELNWRTL